MTVQAEGPVDPGRFLAMVGMLVWRRSDGKYLLLRRSPSKDFAPGEWETGSGRLEQGEGFVQALRRECMEELSLEVRIECILGVTHFYRGRPDPANEMVGVSFGCSVADASGLSLSDEHSEHAWMTAEESAAFLPPSHWLSDLVTRAEAFRRLMPKELQRLHWTGDFEF
ncbi:MAG: NUDIX domain-containing protein [Dehalococcoidia bacterium]|nr:NUDIX domain-containing protein [Dehalococcoidia bacterium]MYD27893.1 NUDIX domain-containing protein [Dehalococcoidia bacterium]